MGSGNMGLDYGMWFQLHSLSFSNLITFYLCYQRKSLIRVLPLWTRNVWASSHQVDNELFHGVDESLDLLPL